MSARVLLRPVGYAWALPNTLLGVLFLVPTLLTGGGVRLERGAVEVYGGFARVFLRHCLFVKASALCLGHVILGQDRDCLDHSRDHEHVHVRQYERWGAADAARVLPVEFPGVASRRSLLLRQPLRARGVRAGVIPGRADS